MKKLGLPTPQIEWSKNGEILNDSRIQQFNNNAGQATLKVNQTRKEDSGKYMCTARNDSGVATSSAQLIVRSLFKKLCFNYDLARMIAPDFTKRLISEEAAEGEQLKWTVKIIGEPEPKVTWLRDGQLIPNCEEVKLIKVRALDFLKKNFLRVNQAFFP